ncbi:MAG: winged helix-turn-helix transcriptional regulator [Thaumarchaeota archaeon]|nr:winged helix-turn-helix transcriptional regulator [Nitrososphaerota archaeon]MBI3641705.1 winged helix-turn-helix transcriptional regulator [Nitrososphaerota archaeon]
MEKEDFVDKDKDFMITMEDSVEILTTDSDRLKIIGEEISNDTGRAVLSKLFEGITSVSEIAKSLDISVQLVAWHIERLLNAGLIRIHKVELSSKNKEVRHYEPKKLALVIIPSSVAKSTTYSNLLKKALQKTYDKIPVFVTFIGSSITIYLTQKILNPGQNNLSLFDPESVHSFYQGIDLIISLVGGMTIASAIWFLKKTKDKKASNS